jgi:capsular exopolysaccharide synthesis family protein
MIQPEGDNSLDKYRDRVSKFSSELDLALVLYITKRSFWFVLIFFILSFGTATIYLRYSQPEYQSSTIIQINENSEASQVLQMTKFENTGQNKIAEAIEQIRSKIFLKRVVAKSDIQISYFNEGTFKNNELYNSSPYFVKFNVKKDNIYGTKIYVKFNTPNAGKISFIADGKNQVILFTTFNVINSPYFDLSISPNSLLNKQSVQQQLSDNEKSYFIINNIDNITANLQTKIDIKLINEAAKTIQIKVTDVNAQKSKALVNLISKEYLDFDVERKSESSKSILAFISEQLELVYGDLKSSESNLQEFRKDHNYNVKDDAVDVNTIRLSKIEDDILKVELDEKILAELQQSIIKNKSIDTYQLISLISGTEYENSIKEYTQNIQKLLLEKETLLYMLTPNSENIKQINFNIENQKKLLIETINSVRLNYKSRYSALNQKYAEYQGKNVSNPDEDLEHSRLMRLFSIREKYYTMLLEKKTEFSISKAGFVSQNVILEEAINDGAYVSPNKKTTLIIAFLVAILLSLLLIFIRYFLHDKITSVNDVVNNIDASISVLGIVPNYESDVPVSQLVVDKNPKSQIAEAFRSIRSNLHFINNTEGPKIVAVTSSISGEGKTFVCLNVAGILAYTGKKVILLDLDMRKPKIHKGFGVSNDVGMSTILTNLTPTKDCINKSHFPNLDYITAGPIPPNPSELIINDRLNLLISELKELYDYIVFDNPPIGLVTDGITTIQKADYPIYVFRADYSRKSFVQILDKLINEGNIKNLSIILNGVDTTRSAYGYKYGYGYGYGYNYGNGYYSDDKVEKKTGFSKLWK